MTAEHTLGSESTESESPLILAWSHSVDRRLASGEHALPSEEPESASAVELGVV
jgi:hypothetical protein